MQYLCSLPAFSILWPTPGAQGLEDEKVHLNVQDRQLADIFMEIENQTSLRFAYNPNIIQQYVASIRAKSISVDKALNIILQDTTLEYQVINDKILILHKERPRELDIISKLQDPIRFHKIPLEAFQLNISGTVTDQEGEPLIGVNILVEGTNHGTTTDFDGRYTLSNVGEEAVLIFSYIGYQSQSVSVSGKSTVDVTLLSDAQMLDEVIVV